MQRAKMHMPGKKNIAMALPCASNHSSGSQIVANHRANSEKSVHGRLWSLLSHRQREQGLAEPELLRPYPSKKNSRSPFSFHSTRKKTPANFMPASWPSTESGSYRTPFQSLAGHSPYQAASKDQQRIWKSFFLVSAECVLQVMLFGKHHTNQFISKVFTP